MQECYMASVSAHFIKYLCAQKNGHQNRGGGEIHLLCFTLPLCLSLSPPVSGSLVYI